MPGNVIVFVVVVFPLPQLNVAPVVVDKAVNVSLIVVHVKTVGEAIAALGIGVFWITVVLAEAVHPLDGSVIVSV